MAATKSITRRIHLQPDSVMKSYKYESVLSPNFTETELLQKF